MKTASNSRVLRTITLMIIAMLLSPFAYGKVIYVDDDATWANNGMGWATAYLCLQDAVAAALSGDEIRVAKGVYKPDQHFIKGRFTGVQASGDRTATFQLINRVTIKGGYAGHGEPDPDARDVDLYETILSGDLNGNDGPGFTNNAENSYHVLTGSETDQTGVLDGFIITAGNANANNSIPYDRGGGMYNGQSSPTLNNCKFNGNFSDSGGAMYNWQSRPTLTNCTFSSNRADKGGGAINNWQSSPAFTNCTFSNNSAGSGGGAINNVTESNSTMINCTLTGNSAGWDGGGIGNVSSSPTFTNCIFYENFSERNGGGMSNSDGSHPNVTNCTFSGNSAYRHGGGMGNEQSSPMVTNCTFSRNSAQAGGGMINRTGSPSVTNCVFIGNSAYGHGGAIRNWYSSYPILMNCTFNQNSAANKGGCMRNSHHSDATLTNCILWDDYASDEAEISSTNNSNAWVSYSDVQGGWPGQGNINTDPFFARPGYLLTADSITDNPEIWITGDYHLKSEAGRWDPNIQSWIQDDVTSPCIDAGDPNSPIAFEPSRNGGIINMGAYGGTAEASKSINGSNTKYSGGTGEPNDPYLIYTSEQVNTIGLHEEDWDKHFKLMADIDLSAYTETDFNIIGYVNIVGIGRNSQVERKPFTGVFDGDGHKISNFSYTAIDTGIETGGIGIFKLVSGENAHIKNLGLINPNTEGQHGVGSLAGEIGSGTVSGCYVEGGSVSGDVDVGGLVGVNEGIITNCATSCRVSGNYVIGGLTGGNHGSITGCYSSAIVLGKDTIGGLVGSDWNGTITNSASFGNVSGTGGYVGGLLGRNNYGTVTACRSSANVSGTLHVGGLVGDNEGTISNCYSLGNVTGMYHTGGLVGFNWGSSGSTITDCYSAGSVLGTIDTGGLVGSNDGNRELKDCFWDIQTGEQSTSAGGTGKTTYQMQIESTFTNAGWDFVGETKNGTEDSWTFYEGANYPRLVWEKEPIEPVAPSPYGGGTGTAANPYLIYTAEQLNMIGLLQHDWGRHFKLMADINLSGFAGTDFNIIGYAESFEDRNAFTGVFDGNGKTISDFSHTSTDKNYVALFAYIAGDNALIKNLGMINPDINAGSVWSWRVASLVAINSGTIFNCYVKGGTISGNEDVGGLVGNNFSNGTIINCYSSTDVSGNKDAGGLVGENSSGKITYCYSTAGVSGRYNLGGLVGYNSGDILSSFWDIEASGQTTSSGGTAKTTAEMQMKSTFIGDGWDFVDETTNGTENIWWIDEGNDYPRLWWELISEN